jgi:glycolate dehydrogenase FAD-binding subunit
MVSRPCHNRLTRAARTACRTLMDDVSTPSDQPALASMLREAFGAGTPIYPVGGGTSLGFGLPIARPGTELSLANLNRVVDYPARDMTITVEAGIAMAALASTLVAERQRLPIDVPQSERATLGGVIATNFSGPLRYGHGTIRDYVIGISAVDGRGVPFKGGGRVVKNVAGYDFCKLLVGSLGTLAVITQVTLKVKPIPERTALVGCRVKSFDHAERLLAGMVSSETRPCALEIVSGPAWGDDSALEPLAPGELGHLIVALEGTEPEVEWMTGTLLKELASHGAQGFVVADDRSAGLWSRLREFPAAVGQTSLSAAPGALADKNVCPTLVLKANVPPSRTVEMIRLMREAVSDCSIQAHAGNGIVLARFPTFAAGGVSRILIGRLQPAAQNAGGNLIVFSSTIGGELTRQAVWGAASGSAMLMEAVKRQFDPKNLLNPGRFVYANP